MKDKKNMALSIVAVATLLLLIVGATYAYFTAQTGSGAGADVNVTTSTTDNLTFNTEGEITIHATPQNFGKDGTNLSDSAKASATLRANNATNSATSNYNLYLNIEVNDFVYTTADETAELILTITDPNGNEVTELAGYNYVTVNGVSGFDITTVSGQVKLASKYEITTIGTTTHEWNVELTFVNLNSDQEENTGKTFTAELLIESSVPYHESCNEELLACHVAKKTDNVSLYYHDENLENGANDNSYRYSGTDGNNIVPEYSGGYSGIDSVVKWHCDLPDTDIIVNQLEEQYPSSTVKVMEYDPEGYCHLEVEVSKEYEDDGGTWEETIYSDSINGSGYWYIDYDKNIQYDSKAEAAQKVANDGYIVSVDDIIESHCEMPDTTELVNNLKKQYPQATVSADPYLDSCETLVIAWDDEDEYYFDFIRGTKYYTLVYDSDKKEFTKYAEVIQQAKEDGYVYTVDNYVCFGSDEEECPSGNIYRIIGVFDNRVKLIKDGIGVTAELGKDGAYLKDTEFADKRYAWNTATGSNIWSESNLNKINLNTNYLTNIGEKWSDMIALTRWSVGGIPESISKSQSPKVIYDAEMSYDEEYAAKVGLAYVSDHVYASTSAVWVSDQRRISWISRTGQYSSDFTITRNSDSASDAYYFSQGKINSASSGAILRPTFYLLDSVEYKGGKGTYSDPYRIS